MLTRGHPEGRAHRPGHRQVERTPCVTRHIHMYTMISILHIYIYTYSYIYRSLCIYIDSG